MTSILVTRWHNMRKFSRDGERLPPGKDISSIGSNFLKKLQLSVLLG